LQYSDANLGMIGDGNGDCAGWQFLLHNDMAAVCALPRSQLFAKYRKRPSRKGRV